MKNENIRADEIYLASSKELFEEAGEIAQNTQTEEKYSFILQYNANQREFVQSILETVGAIVNNDNLEECLLSVMMNMTQLAFIKCLDCVERVKTDEVHNPYLIEDEVNDIDDRMIVEASTAHVGMTTNDVQVMSLASEELGQDEVATTASYATSATSADCPCSTNTSMSTAKVISDEGSVGGYICCPCTEQWFKFTATRTGRYTIGSTGSKDTIGTLYDGNGNKIAENDDFAPGGKINFRIVIDLAAGNTYYVKVRLHGNATGRYTLRVTERLYVNYVRINMDRITLQKGVTYELPITPFYVYKGYNGAQPISGLDVSVIPSNADEQKIWWYSQSNDVFTISHGSDEDGNRYAHLVVTGVGDANLYAVDWNENGKRDECVVTVGTPYMKKLKTLGSFSNEEVDLIQQLYDKIDEKFTSESKNVKAWKCARLLSEFCYDYFSSMAGINFNKWDDVAGSVTKEENRKEYFMETLGYTSSEYDKLNTGLLRNHKDAGENYNIIDFTHMQYALAARLAYTLDKDGALANLGSGLYTINYGVYSDEEVSYLAGWLGDAVITNMSGEGIPVMKNDDYMADLDAENVYRLIVQGSSSIDALNEYYSSMTVSNTRAEIFLQHIPYETVKEKVFNALIDSGSNADENSCMNTIKSSYPDTYNFLRSLCDGHMNIFDYT